MFRFFGKAAPSRSMDSVLTSAPSEAIEGGKSASSAPNPLPNPVPTFANEKGGRLVRKLGSFVLRHPKSTIFAVSLVILTGSGLGFYGYALHQWTLAQAAVKEQRPAEARKCLDVCLLVWPRSVAVHLLAARADRLSSNLDGAEAHLQTCLKLQHGATEDIQLEFLLMRVQRGQEDETARDLFYYVDSKHPETPLILETLARANMHHLRYGPALHCLDRWIKEYPDSVKAYQWRAWVLERVSDFDGAMGDYKKALQLAPDSFEIRFRVAEIYLERSNPPAAIEHLEWLRRKFPDRAIVSARLGQCFYLEGEVEKARPLLEAAVEELPDDSNLLLTLAKLELQEERPAEAEQWLTRLLKVDPYDQEAEFALFTSLQSQGRIQEAAVAMDKWKTDKAQWEKANKLLKQEALGPSRDPNAAYEIGAALLNVGQDNMALYWLNQALERNDAYQPALKALVDYYEKKGDSKTATAYRRKITEPDKKTDSP